jgi:hypothetical protein
MVLAAIIRITHLITKVTNKHSIAIDTLLKARDRFLAKNEGKVNPGEPYYAELFNEDQLEQYGKLLANSHKVQKG